MEIGNGLGVLENSLRFWYSTLLLLIGVNIYEISVARGSSLTILQQQLLLLGGIISAFATGSRMQSVYNFLAGPNPAISFIYELNRLFNCLVLKLDLLLVVGERRMGLAIYLQLGWGQRIGMGRILNQKS